MYMRTSRKVFAEVKLSMKFTGVMILGAKLLLSMQVIYTDCFSTEEQHHRDKAVKKAGAPAIITQQIAAKHYRRSNPNFQAAHPSRVPLLS